MPPSDHGDLNPGDLATLEAFGRGNAWLRALLCTLARRGLQLRQAEPERADAILAALARYPVYKAGQFLFDLMEWEDFMLDGPPPPALGTALDPRALGRLSDALRRLQAQLDGGLVAEAAPQVESNAWFDDTALPPLDGSHFLYQYVVLGAFRSASLLAEQAELP